MTNFKNLEIASAVSAHEKIEVEERFFGFRTKVYYKPTRSEVDSIRNYCTMSSGSEIQRFLAKFQSDPTCAEKAKLSVQSDPNGSYRLEWCASRDGEFLAVQLFRYGELDYQPVSELRFYEGTEAKLLHRVLCP